MTTSVFIVEYNDKVLSGYQIFRDELIACLSSDSTITIGIIVIDSDFKRLTIYVDQKVTTILVPHITGSHKYDRITAALKLYIPDKQSTIFFCNFAPASKLLLSLSKFYPFSRRILILHDFIAAYYLKGHLSLYNSLREMPVDRIKHPTLGAIDIALLRHIHSDYRQAFQSATNIICLCEDTMTFIERSFCIPMHKLELIPNGLRDAYNNNDKTLRNVNQPFRFLIVGRMTENKGFCTMLEAAKELRDKYSNHNWEIICAGPIGTSRLENIDQALKPFIRIMGSLTRNELYNVYSTVDAGLVLSNYEQCSYAGIEMKMFALPVIAITSHGVKNMFSLQNSISINAESNRLCSDIASGMKSLIDGGVSNLKKYSKKSRDDFINRYSASIMSEHYLSFLHRVKTGIDINHINI